MNPAHSKTAITIYTLASYCPYCDRAKALMQQLKIPYNEIQVDRDDDTMREFLQEKSDMRTFPQIFFGDVLIGGFQELDQKYRNKELQTLIAPIWKS